MLQDVDDQEKTSVYSGMTEQCWPINDSEIESTTQKKSAHGIKPAHPKTAGFNILVHGLAYAATNHTTIFDAKKLTVNMAFVP